METIVKIEPFAMGAAVDRRVLEEQWERLMREHGPSVMRLAAAHESNPANRDDLVQEIALALWKALPQFRGECSERTLVFRIAHNRAVTEEGGLAGMGGPAQLIGNVDIQILSYTSRGKEFPQAGFRLRGRT